MKKIEYLIELLEKSIKKEKPFINKYESISGISLNRCQNIKDMIELDIYNLSIIEEKEIKEIINLYDIKKEDKIILKNQIIVIQKIFTINKNNKTNINLTDEQNKYLDDFLYQLYKIIDNKTNYKNKYYSKYTTSIDKINKYKTIIENIKNPNNINYIDDIDTINNLFKEDKISLNDQEEILCSIIDYNKTINDKIIEKTRKKIDRKELVKTLFKYNIDLDKLDNNYVERLLDKGNIDNIEGVIKKLKQNNYDINKILYKKEFILLLLYSTPEIIDDITSVLTRYMLNTDDILKMIYCLLKGNNNDIYDEFYYSGRYEYINKNINILKEYGFDINEIIKKCKYLLSMNSNKLENNLEIYRNYGLNLDISDELICDNIYGLLGTDIDKTVDIFIEISNKAFEYLKDNLNLLKSNKKDLYNLILHLKSNTYYKGTKNYNNVEYKNKRVLKLNDKINNKLINFVDVCTNEEYNEILKRNNCNHIDEKIFDNKYIKELKQYESPTDPLIYKFGNTRISKLKVYRIYSKLVTNINKNNKELLLYSICYNSLLNKYQYNNIKQIIENLGE